LKGLNAKEFKQLGKHIQQGASKGYLNKLYQYLAKYYPLFEHKNLNKSTCYQFVFQASKSELKILDKAQQETLFSKKLKNPFYDLNNAIIQYLIQLELEYDSYEKNMLLLKSLRRRKMDEECVNLIDKEIAKLDKSNEKYLDQDLERFQYNHFKHKMANKIVDNEGLEHEMMNDLDAYYFNVKLIYNCVQLTREKIFFKDIDNMMIPEIVEKLEKKELKKVNPSIMLNYYFLKLMSEENESNYEDVKKYYFEYYKNLNEEDKINGVIYLTNYCNRENRFNHSTKLKEMMVLYKFSIEKKILVEDNTINTNQFKNIVTVGLAMKEDDWVTNFIESHQQYLKDNDKKNTVTLCEAKVFQSQGENSKVIELLQHVEFQDFMDNVITRTMLLKSYYELKEWHTLDFFFESFSKFVKRNKAMSKHMKIALSNMIAFSKFLVKAKHSNQYTKKDIELKFEDSKPLLMNKWLLQKIDEDFSN